MGGVMMFFDRAMYVLLLLLVYVLLLLLVYNAPLYLTN